MAVATRGQKIKKDEELTSESISFVFIGIMPGIPGMHLAVFAMFDDEYFFV